MGGEYAAHGVGLLLVYLFFFFVREQHSLGRLCVCSPFFRPILCSEGFCVGCSLVDLSLYARSETFFLRGFFPLPIGQKEEWDANSNRTHNTLLRSSEEHEKRTLSVLQTKAFRNNKARRPKRKRRGRPKAKSYIMAFYRKTQRRIRDKKKTFYIICLGFVNVALSFVVFLYVSKSLLKDSILFESPPFSTQTCRGVESIKQTPEYH